jgi:hypothetical protein
MSQKISINGRMWEEMDEEVFWKNTDGEAQL